METGIRIEGGKADIAGTAAATVAIEQVFRVGRETGMDQETIRAGLATLDRLVPSADHAHIEHVHLDGRTIEVE